MTEDKFQWCISAMRKAEDSQWRVRVSERFAVMCRSFPGQQWLDLANRYQEHANGIRSGFVDVEKSMTECFPGIPGYIQPML